MLLVSHRRSAQGGQLKIVNICWPQLTSKSSKNWSKSPPLGSYFLDEKRFLDQCATSGERGTCSTHLTNPTFLTWIKQLSLLPRHAPLIHVQNCRLRSAIFYPSQTGSGNCSKDICGIVSPTFFPALFHGPDLPKEIPEFIISHNCFVSQIAISRS